MLLDNDTTRLRHIIKASDDIFKYAGGKSNEEILDNLPLQALLVHNLMIIGEAASRLTVDLRRSHPEIPWQKMISLRHRIVHDYLRVDLDVVLITVRGPLREVYSQVKALIDSEI